MSIPYLFVSVLCVSSLVIWAIRTLRSRATTHADDNDGGLTLPLETPELDLPPGISLPINDFEPEYQWHGEPVRRELELV